MPPPTATATVSPPTSTVAPSDEVMTRIMDAGTIVVGTTADYRPFEYYDQNLRLDGYDIFLMRELANLLGVAVEFEDMAFDGLIDALVLGQIDAAISAISVTPERQARVDFTNVYYVGESASLARADSGITLNSFVDAAAYRIGVQRGSVYEQLVRQNLIGAG